MQEAGKDEEDEVVEMDVAGSCGEHMRNEQWWYGVEHG